MNTVIQTQVQYGKTYTARCSEFYGEAVAIRKWREGAVMVLLRPPPGEEGKLLEDQWFDEDLLVGVKPVVQAVA